MSLLLPLLVGCAPEPPTVTLDPKFSTVAHVAFAGSGRGYVRYAEPDGALATPVEATAADDHDIAVIGLHPGTTTTITAVLVDDGGDETELPPVDVDVPGFVPALGITAVRGESDGFVLTHSLTNAALESVVVVDGAGREVWRYPLTQGERVLTVDVVDDGTLWFSSMRVDTPGAEGQAHHVSFDGTLDETIAITGLAGAALSIDGGVVFGARAFGPWDTDDILWDQVAERSAEGVDRKIFDFKDTYVPVETCAHQRVSNGDKGLFDWSHVSSLLGSADGETVYAMSRHLDGLFAIERRTGAVKWVMGGAYNTMTLVGEPFEHAHTSWYRDGRLWVMDNGNHRGYSRIVGYDIDEAARTATSVAVYDEPDRAVVEFLGDVKPTGHGDVLVSWSTRGRVERLAPDGASTWSFDTALAVAPGRVTFLDDLYGANP